MSSGQLIEGSAAPGLQTVALDLVNGTPGRYTQIISRGVLDVGDV